MRKWVPRLVLALAIGVALPFLPTFLTQSVGPSIGGGGGLGLSAGVSAGTFAALFLGGILTSLTPCVYPLIPITVSIFGARQAEHRGRSIALSAAYVAGIAAMFSALGLFAALSGKAFGALLSSPAVIAVLAVFLVALAASMFGAFEIALPSALQQKLSSIKAAGFAGAFGMGLVAGVIAAPCTGPVLAGVLTYVAAQRNAVLGFWMLFTYAIGMGMLFFVLGATTLRLPRSGPWMETVKSVLGIAL
ncbi:MAG: cytochrome C biogenesis protein, partial [Deltaproteobacteria bacterium]